MSETERRLDKIESELHWLKVDSNLNQSFRESIRKKEIETEDKKWREAERTGAFWWGMCIGFSIGFFGFLILETVI